MKSEREEQNAGRPPGEGTDTLTVERPASLTLGLDESLTLELAATGELEGYRDIRVALATPEIRLGQVDYNEGQILALIEEATQAGADVLLFSDMALTGRSAGDLFFQRSLQDACLESLARITRATADSQILVLLSLPLRLEGRLFKATALLYRGGIVGMTPAAYLSREERRWFSDPFAQDPGSPEDFSCELIAAGDGADQEGITEIQLPPAECPTILRLGLDQPLPPEKTPASGQVSFEFPLCEMTAQNLLSFSFRFVNLCTVIPCLAVRPSLLPRDVKDCREVRLFNFEPAHAQDALSHGTIPVAAIADARMEWTGDYRRIRRELIRRSLRDHSIVLYAGAGKGESSSAGVYAGHRLIMADGRVLAEGQPYTTGLTLADLAAGDLFRIRSDRGSRWNILKTGRAEEASPKDWARFPFLMRQELDPVSFYQETLAIQAQGLADRLDFLKARPVLGLSGGLDSAVALLVSLEALRLLDRPASDLLALYLPGPGSSEKSGELARILGEAAGADFREIPIGPAVDLHLKAIGHDGKKEDVTFENAQARERTQILMDLSNLEGGMVVGTGDLSELALGWCTYNADQMSMYAVNASLAKTVIREMTRLAADLLAKGESPLFPAGDRAQAAAAALRTILARPVSPELLPTGPEDQLVQLTEEVIGPYELIDFFLWHLIFQGWKVSAVYELACRDFEGLYKGAEIQGWLTVFIRRFFKHQFKRTASPEGVAAFPWRLLPATAWQMPGDAFPDLWVRELESYLADKGKDDHDLS